MQISHRVGSLVFAGTLAVTLSAGLAGVANAASPPSAQSHSAVTPQITPPAPPDWTEIEATFFTGSNLSLCVDDTNGSASEDTPLQLYHCHGTDSKGGPQRWQFLPTGVANDYQIRNAANGMCIDFRSGEDEPGNQIALRPCNQSTWWQVVPVPGYGQVVWIKDVFDNLAITSASEADTNHNALIAEPIRGADSSLNLVGAPDPAQMFQI